MELVACTVVAVVKILVLLAVEIGERFSFPFPSLPRFFREGGGSGSRLERAWCAHHQAKTRRDCLCPIKHHAVVSGTNRCGVVNQSIDDASSTQVGRTGSLACYEYDTFSLNPGWIRSNRNLPPIHIVLGDTSCCTR